MKRTPFHEFHDKHEASFVDFAGWEMPIRYGSVIEEHKYTRESASLFDVSHMGRIKFTGRHARRFLETIVTRRISTMNEMQCRYALVCNEAGGVLDDVIVYRFPDHWYMVCNAANREKLLKHFDAVKAEHEFVVEIKDETEETAMVAVQGPNVMEMIGNFSKEVPTLKNYTFCIKNLMIIKLVISRTGYTGEDGVEVILPGKMSGMAMKLLIKDGGVVKPAGLAARDTLRTEAGMPLYGHELDEETTPLEAGLNFAVNLDKGEEGDDYEGPAVPGFIGQAALQKQHAEGLSKTLIGIKLDGKRSPRQGMAIQVDGNVIGTVTSGCLSPTLDHPIAMGYVKPGTVNAGDKVSLDFGKQVIEGEVVALPFYKRSK